MYSDCGSIRAEEIWSERDWVLEKQMAHGEQFGRDAAYEAYFPILQALRNAAGERNHCERNHLLRIVNGVAVLMFSKNPALEEVYYEVLSFTLPVLRQDFYVTK